jgi:hypothetical protein
VENKGKLDTHMHLNIKDIQGPKVCEQILGMHAPLMVGGFYVGIR